MDENWGAQRSETAKNVYTVRLKSNQCVEGWYVALQVQWHQQC